MVDEIGKFWVVTTPTGTSELGDILFESTVAEMSLQFRGGLDPYDILGLFKDEARAEAFASDRLETQRLARMAGVYGAVPIMTTFYTLADAPCTADLERLGIAANWRTPFRPGVVGLVAKRTGETRIPLAGEWYLSGAKPEAYRMPADGVGDYRIVELVLVTGRTVFEEVSS